MLLPFVNNKKTQRFTPQADQYFTSRTPSPHYTSFWSYLEVLDAVIDAGRKDLVLPAAPCLGDYLDDLLQGTAHPVEHGVLVDPRRLTIWVPQASLWKEFEVKCQSSCPPDSLTSILFHVSQPRLFTFFEVFMIRWLLSITTERRICRKLKLNILEKALKTWWSEKCLLTLFDYIPAHIVHLSDY